MTYNEAVEALQDYMRTSLNVNDRTYQKAKEALDYLEARKWVPVFDGNGRMPETEDGYSDLVLVSFHNTDSVLIGQYREDELGGSFYEGEACDEPLTKFGLMANAWKPLPEPYRET